MTPVYYALNHSFAFAVNLSHDHCVQFDSGDSDARDERQMNSASRHEAIPVANVLHEKQSEHSGEKEPRVDVPYVGRHS